MCERWKLYHSSQQASCGGNNSIRGGYTCICHYMHAPLCVYANICACVWCCWSLLEDFPISTAATASTFSLACVHAHHQCCALGCIFDCNNFKIYKFFFGSILIHGPFFHLNCFFMHSALFPLIPSSCEVVTLAPIVDSISCEAITSL